MSQFTSRDGLTSHTRPTPSSPYPVSPTTSSNSLIRNNSPAGTQPVLSNTLIPRDYLTTLSKSRLNAADSPRPHPQSPTSVTSSSGISSHATARALSQEQSSDESGDDIDLIIQRSENVPEQDLNTAKTRSNAAAASQTPPPEPSSLAGPAKLPASKTSDILGAMPRTSSIDSAISTISTSSYSLKPSVDQKEPSVTEIRNLIATAGSAENLVQHLLRDKANAASQNAQLWRLVDKQRALLLGLNKDLERVSKERDRYRKRAKDLQVLTENFGNTVAQNHTPPTSAGAGEESLSQKKGDAGQSALPSEDWRDVSRSQPVAKAVKMPVEVGMMPSPLHFQSHHAQDPAPTSVPIVPSEINYRAYPNPSIDTTIQQQQPPPPKLAALTTQLAPPAFSVTEATPLAESPARMLPSQRKPPPKPLDLKPTREEETQSQTVESGENTEIEDYDRGRGRRKTREEDDQDREIAVLQEEEARSRSKKDKRSKLDQTRGDGLPSSPNAILEKSSSPRATVGNNNLVASQAAPDTLHPTGSGTEKRLLSPPLRSPGLPASPRPAERALISPLPQVMSQSQSIPTLPMSPRNGGFPLSPRAPKQPLPNPTNIHSPEVLGQKLSEAAAKRQAETDTKDRPQVQDNMGGSDVPPVYRGLVSPTWPELLLPPNALPSIQVKVASSRLRPSRFSVLGFKPQEDNSVFSLSIFSRSNSGELWRIEKIPAALPHLDQQLRPRCPDLPRLPDRKLFTGHAPATLDTRRIAIDSYFEELLDTHVDEQSALIICKFLSTDVLEPQTDNTQRGAPANVTQGQTDTGGKLKKTGYLTKKGKNFGGWKSRYFVLDSPELRYFEAPGGAHLGTIKLLSARIGRQTTTDIPTDDGDADSQFRHAFLILEPKRKDSASYVRHVLCAENDQERDDWVRALLHFVEEVNSQESRPTTSAGQAGESLGMTGNPRSLLRGTDFGDSQGDSGATASSPTLGQRPSGSNSPSTPSPGTPDATTESFWPKPASASSGVSNATSHRLQPRQNQPFQQPSKEQKIRNLFQFRKSSHEQLSTSQSSDDRMKQHDQQSHRARAYVRPVFGLALAEAVEVCPPHDVNVLLPAVVYRCIEYLQAKRAANEEGLFRLSGSNIVIRTLKERFNTEGDIDLVADDEYYDVHAVASLFKTYLRELPSTLLTRDLHLEFLKVLEFEDRQQKIVAFNVLVHQLPRVNFTLLRALSEYLLEVVQNSDRNKMSVKNVGIVFSPTLNIPAPVFAMFLTDFDLIFNQNLRQERQEDIGMMSTLLAPPTTDNPPEIRSPRSQIYSHLPATPAQHHMRHDPNSGMQANKPLEPSHPPEASDFGMAPVQQSAYESRNYVSIPPQAPPPQPMYAPPQPHQQNHPASNHHPQQNHPANSHHPQQRPQYRMFAPQDAANDKAKRRESAMLLF